MGEQDPSIAKTAVKEGLKLSTEFDPVFRLQILEDAAHVYLQLKDQDAALKTIAEGSAFAQQLYAKDADLTAPNTTLKAEWPQRMPGEISSVWQPGSRRMRQQS